MKFCFVMYPWERVDPEWDSTLRLIHEAYSRGHLVAITTSTNLTIRHTVSQAFCSVLSCPERTEDPRRFYHLVERKPRMLPLAGFDAIIMRDNPPLDATVLNFLDSVKEDSFICNDVHGLRVASNKIFTAALWDPVHDYVPVTHVSKNREYLERVFAEYPGEKMILKPLNGYGGRGVVVLDKERTPDFGRYLETYLGENRDQYVILQEFVPGAEEGDVRILMLNGEAIGAMKRVPGPDDPRANIAAGATAVRHELTREERALCKHLGPKLVREGLYFVGLDVIGGKLIEVNVLSPGGVTRINALNKDRLQNCFVDFIESVVSTKELLLARKTEYQRTIEDAVTEP